MRKGDIISLPAGTEVWRETLPETLAAWREEDRRSGRSHDEAGESILYPGQWADFLPVDTIVLITATRSVPWRSLSRRPKGLRQGRTMDGIEITFVQGSLPLPGVLMY